MSTRKRGLQTSKAERTETFFFAVSTGNGNKHTLSIANTKRAGNLIKCLNSYEYYNSYVVI